MYMHFAMVSIKSLSLYITRRKSRFGYTHGGLLRKETVGGSGVRSWIVYTVRLHSRRPSPFCRNCHGALGCGLSSWSLLWNHLYTSVSSTSLWSPQRSAISAERITFGSTIGLQKKINQSFLATAMNTSYFISFWLWLISALDVNDMTAQFEISQLNL